MEENYSVADEYDNREDIFEEYSGRPGGGNGKGNKESEKMV